MIQLAVDEATAQFGPLSGPTRNRINSEVEERNRIDAGVETRNRLRCESMRYAVLESAMDAGTASRTQCSQLARKSGEVSGDDLKNFLQRWVIVQVDLT